jgi:cytochrome c biogenesis protein
VYYEGSRRPKDFYSTLTVVKEGVEQATKRIEVNHPLKYEGIYFYQSSYGETGRGLTSTLLVTDPKTGTARTEQFESRPRELPDFNLTLQVVQVIPDFAMDSERGVYSKSSQPNNPAALVRVELPDGSSRTTWLLANYPEPRPIKDLPVDLTFLKFTSLQYTGLQVVYDPGVWVIWTGCTLMVLGLFFAFFISHRRVWVRLEGEGATVRVRLAGTADKNREAFGEEFRRLGERISNSAGR